jgi:hypothetical protein
MSSFAGMVPAYACDDTARQQEPPCTPAGHSQNTLHAAPAGPYPL